MRVQHGKFDIAINSNHTLSATEEYELYEAIEKEIQAFKNYEKLKTVKVELTVSTTLKTE